MPLNFLYFQKKRAWNPVTWWERIVGPSEKERDRRKALMCFEGIFNEHEYRDIGEDETDRERVLEIVEKIFVSLASEPAGEPFHNLSAIKIFNILEKMCEHVDIFSVPVFKSFLAFLKKNIEWSGGDGIFAKLFLINEIVAKYRLPEDLEQEVREFLKYIIKDWREHHEPVTLAQEGLELLAYNHKKEPIEAESYLVAVEKCIAAAKGKINRNSFSGLTVLLLVCLIVFWLI